MHNILNIQAMIKMVIVSISTAIFLYGIIYIIFEIISHEDIEDTPFLKYWSRLYKRQHVPKGLLKLGDSRVKYLAKTHDLSHDKAIFNEKIKNTIRTNARRLFHTYPTKAHIHAAEVMTTPEAIKRIAQWQNVLSKKSYRVTFLKDAYQDPTLSKYTYHQTYLKSFDNPSSKLYRDLYKLLGEYEQACQDYSKLVDKTKSNDLNLMLAQDPFKTNPVTKISITKPQPLEILSDDLDRETFEKIVQLIQNK